MAYNGMYLLKVGSTPIPNKYIVMDTYKCIPDQRQDVDSYRDLNQDLHRNVSIHYKTIVQFNIRAGLSETSLRTFINLIQTNFENAHERKVRLEYFNTDTGEYEGVSTPRYFYMVQPNYQIIRIEGNELFYNTMEIKFIEY